MNLGAVGARITEMTDEVITAARVPGAAIAVVKGEQIVLAEGLGVRDVTSRARVTVRTLYPIASTAKAMTATMLATLVADGALDWDAPIRRYVTGFSLPDRDESEVVTLRDLLTMQSGLPRHDWLYLGMNWSRAEVVQRLRHLPPSASLRERFQYNNIGFAAAAHVAEEVTQCPWDELMRDTVIGALGMSATTVTECPTQAEVTTSYHETSERNIIPTEPIHAAALAPSGTDIYSTIEDMARWVQFNLSKNRLVAKLHTARVPTSGDPSAPTPAAHYGMGWFVDRFVGQHRVSHGGYWHDVNSEVALLPGAGLGVVAFVNFGPPRLARFLTDRALEILLGQPAGQRIRDHLTEYERKVALYRAPLTTPARVPPSADLLGSYTHPGYGPLDITENRGLTVLRRGSLEVELRPVGNDEWQPIDNGRYPIHEPHPFRPSSRIRLNRVSSDCGIATSILVPFEPATHPIIFT